ncbi:DUF72 domain-containing protein [Ramlibacter sp. XY19]|uniref:DUF72 domain-containing protein n=1 Tax=Ramlibacter paludis TaxID=2908000 RepID=UPI0023DCE48D|nr:DUF72 domain-containing protein [Ramlibacter paludis]
MIRIGCAGWPLPGDVRDAFGPGVSNLARFATRFGAVEINSSFYRPHRRQVWERWAAETPEDFRFSAKLPKTITHERRLVDCGDPLAAFLDEVRGLGNKLHCLLVQLPPSFAFDAAVALPFFERLREAHAGILAIEPRNASWFTPEVDAHMRAMRVARVLADPVRFDEAGVPGGWPGLVYLRLHGSPRPYWSAYESELLARLALRMRQAETQAEEVWCIFDNTAGGKATANALELTRLLAAQK